MKYQAIILAGGSKSGQLLFPLCKGQTKALLPVGNKPIILYQIEMLENSGFQGNKNAIKDVIILYYHEQIKVALAFYNFKINIQFIKVNEESDSASALLSISDIVKKDLIIFSCDSIVDIDLHDLIDFHNTKRSSITMVLKEEDLDGKLGKAPVSCNLDDTFEIMFLAGDQVAHIVNSDECKEEIQIDKNLVLRFKNLKLFPNLFDSHIYICKNQILDLLNRFKSIENFKDDLIPFLLKNQNNQELINLFKPQLQLFERNPFNFTINAYKTNSYVRRINNIKDFYQANYDSLIQGDKAIKIFKQSIYNEQIIIQTQAKITPDSRIGKQTEIGAKSNVIRSVIGKHCKIGEQVKIQNSIIFDDVTILNGSTIINSIISKESYIEENCNIKQSQIGYQSSVSRGQNVIDDTFSSI